MFLPRNLLAHLYEQLVRSSHALAPPVLILVALEPDALCACRIFTSLLKRDFIPHKIQPISGYNDLARAWEELVLPMRTFAGGSGGVVVCLGLGGVDDIEERFFSRLEMQWDARSARNEPVPVFDGYGGVECWVVDARRPWSLENMFDGIEAPVDEDGLAVAAVPGVQQAKITQAYRPGRGGIICFDDGDIEQELDEERMAYAWLADTGNQNPEVMGILEGMSDEQVRAWAADTRRGTGPDDDDDDNRIPDSAQEATRKRGSSSMDDGDSEDEGRPRQRRRSNSSASIPSSPQAITRRNDLASVNRRGGSSDTSRSPSPSDRSSSPPPRAGRNDDLANANETYEMCELFIKYRRIRDEYGTLGASFSEPISSMMYSLASDLGREDNDLLWYTIVGVSSMELSGRTLTGVGLTPISTSGGAAGWNGERGDRIRAVLRDEVRRLNPTTTLDVFATVDHGIIQTHARSPNDNAIRLSPEPRFLLVRHWSLYDSMLHSPYLSAKLHIWSDAGRRRLNKLLAKMGVSLTQCKQSYTHMDMDLKRSLREQLLKYAPQYSLEGLIPPTTVGKEGWGFVRCWGWKACLSAVDVGVVVGAILEIGDAEHKLGTIGTKSTEQSQSSYSQRVRGAVGEVDSDDSKALDASRANSRNERFWAAYDALGSVSLLTNHIHTAQYLHRAILRTGTTLIEKRQIRHLRAFRMAVVKEGPDVQLFTHPGALVKLALWVAEAIVEMEGGRRNSTAAKGSDLVIAGLDEARGSYVVVGLGGGGAVALDKERQKKREEKMKAKEQRKEEKRKAKQLEREQRRDRMIANGDDYDTDDYSESEVETSDDDDDNNGDDSDDEDYDAVKPRGFGRSKFGIAFNEVIEESRLGSRTRQDSFDHCIVDVRKEDLTNFLEKLSEKMIDVIRLEKQAELRAQRAASEAKLAAARARAEEERRKRPRKLVRRRSITPVSTRNDDDERIDGTPALESTPAVSVV